MQQKDREYKGVIDLLSELNKHNRLLTSMFGERNSVVSHEKLLSFVGDEYENLQRILQSGFISGADGGPYNLDERLQQFFEQFLEVEEDIHPAFIESFFKRMQQNIPIGIAKKLLSMKETSDSLSSSVLKGQFVNELIENNILNTEIKGRGK